MSMSSASGDPANQADSILFRNPTLFCERYGWQRTSGLPSVFFLSIMKQLETHYKSLIFSFEPYLEGENKSNLCTLHLT